MKVAGLQEAIARIPAGSVLALGGNTMHRVPFGAVREIVKRHKEVSLITPAGSFAVDALCAAGLVKHISFAYVGYENFGPALFFQQAVEQGRTKICKYNLPSLIAGLRAASFGLSCMPLSTEDSSQLSDANGWREIRDPYSGQAYLAIPALQPDWAIIHVQQADILGNARIYGSQFEDVLLTRAARHVLVTCEELLPAYAFTDQPEDIDIPASLVDTVVYAPRGAWPAACYEHYSLSADEIGKLVSLRRPEDLLAWLECLSPINDRSPVLETPLAQEYLRAAGNGGVERGTAHG